MPGQSQPNDICRKPLALIAPSWGPGNITEGFATQLIEALFEEGYAVTLRPHPETVKKHKKLINMISEQYDDSNNFTVDLDTENLKSFAECSLFISDWSGAALEYAVALRRPVLYIDTPQKLNNDEALKILPEIIEKDIRDEIGVIMPQDLDYFKEALAKLKKKQITNKFQNNCFNIGKSNRCAAEIILMELNSL